jgi:D-alanyl-lipoteichoic acid acyltransferase DltB (MBOAT superfamily)
MLFHTWEFVIFFFVSMLGYVLLLKTRWWMHWLLAASYVFYAGWNPMFLLLIIYSTAVDYIVGLRLEKSPRRKMWLAFSLINNLFLLGFYKYAGFFCDNLRTLFLWTHIPLDVPHPDITLPVGISFFTFQSMSYSIDVYYGNLKVEKSFIRFAAFVALFPQLVAGPIERAKALLPQLHQEPKITARGFADGISLFLVGLFKKAAMADFLSIYADKIYDDPSSYGSLALIFGTYAFAWQIYFDFGGYTDMARGIARIMGIDLMLNFNNPYTAVGLGDFWRRWHISLSSWFRDYVYIPLGGNRTGPSYKVYWNVALTMVISGFWHGAAWTFIIWGAINALGRIATMDIEKNNFYKRIPKIVKQLLVFHFICLTWVFFRANSLDDALTILQRIGGFIGGNAEIPLILFALIALVWVYQLAFNSRFKTLLESQALRVGALAVALTLFLILASSGNQQFIYFQF